MDIDNMPPDELRRRLREALIENERLKKDFENLALIGYRVPATPPVNEVGKVDLWRGT